MNVSISPVDGHLIKAERDVLSGVGDMLGKIDYIYTEYYNEEMYEGYPGLEEIKSLLPGYEVVHVWGYNDLLD